MCSTGRAEKIRRLQKALFDILCDKKKILPIWSKHRQLITGEPTKKKRLKKKVREKALESFGVPGRKENGTHKKYCRHRDKSSLNLERHTFTDSRSSVNSKEGNLKTNSFPETS